MNILIVSQYFWPENFRINDLAKALDKNGYKVIVLTGIPNYPEGRIYKGYKNWITREKYKNINIFRVPLIPRGNASNLMLFLNYLSFLISASLLSPFLIKGKIDKVFIYGGSPLTKAIPAIILGKLKKAPVFLWILDLWPESVFVNNRIKSRILFFLIKLMTRWVYKKCDYILLQSKAMFKPVKENGAHDKQLKYFPSWAEDQFLNDPQDYADQEIIDTLPEGFYITFAGNIGEGQDIETIINAAEKLKDYQSIHWMILGYGSKYDWLIKNRNDRDLKNVHVLGKRPLETMPMYFNFSDILLASLKKKDIYALTLPGKIQSYMASSKPIISMIDGESSRIITEAKCGISIHSEDTDELVQAVLRMSKMSKKELRLMGNNGREYYLEHFHIRKALEKLEDIFSDSQKFSQ